MFIVIVSASSYLKRVGRMRGCSMCERVEMGTDTRRRGDIVDARQRDNVDNDESKTT